MLKIFRKMFKLNSKKVNSLYRNLLLGVKRTIDNGKYLAALDEIKAIALWLYQTNFIYYSRELEGYLRSIADKTIDTNIEIKSTNDNRFVFIDTHGADNRGETQQYLRALMASGFEFIYIHVSDDITKIPDILKEINDYEKAEVITFNKKKYNYIEKAIYILNEIKIYSPKRVLLHLMPWDVVTMLVLSKLNGSEIYNINLTDHAFWLGASFIDYNFEFRKYGKTVSIEKRGLKEEQLLCLPYYPIISKFETFHGFNNIKNNSIIILTGGYYYKMFGKNNFFFKIMDSILDISDNVVILIAGDGDRNAMNTCISTMKNKSRVQLIGNRTDIAEVFRHCDIYLGTYPFPGGLMTQLAAYYSKPIIAYGDDDDNNQKVEEFVNQLNDGIHTIYNFNELINYSKKLINDENYRLEEGEKANSGVMTEKVFDSFFLNLISSKRNVLNWPSVKINYKRFFINTIDNEIKTGGKNFINLIYSLGIYIPHYFPILLSQYIYLKITSSIKTFLKEI